MIPQFYYFDFDLKAFEKKNVYLKITKIIDLKDFLSTRESVVTDEVDWKDCLTWQAYC